MGERIAKRVGIFGKYTATIANPAAIVIDKAAWRLENDGGKIYF
ncbi:hypothetical protein [Tychonema sp. LEGE 06208]|nr:hypothetical protein [Tychonema sp. LEGE 06208]